MMMTMTMMMMTTTTTMIVSFTERQQDRAHVCRTFPPDIWLDITGNNTALGQLGRRMNNEGSLQRGKNCHMILMAGCKVFFWCPAAIDPNPSSQRSVYWTRKPECRRPIQEL
jgi:hypothetical protein